MLPTLTCQQLKQGDLQIGQLHPYVAMVLKKSGSPKCIGFAEMQQILQSAFCPGTLPHKKAFDRTTNVCFMPMKGNTKFVADYCQHKSSGSTGQEQGGARGKVLPKVPIGGNVLPSRATRRRRMVHNAPVISDKPISATATPIVKGCAFPNKKYPANLQKAIQFSTKVTVEK